MYIADGQLVGKQVWNLLTNENRVLSRRSLFRKGEIDRWNARQPEYPRNRRSADRKYWIRPCLFLWKRDMRHACGAGTVLPVF